MYDYSIRSNSDPLPHRQKSGGIHACEYTGVYCIPFVAFYLPHPEQEEKKEKRQ